MKRMMLLVLLLVHSASLIAAENWPEMRGPSAAGHVDSTKLPLQWSEGKNVAWKTPIPGRAWSTPVIHGQQIWLTTATEDGTNMFALCVDKASGKVVHNIKLLDVAKPDPINAVNSYASPSPVIEAGRVYLHFGTYGTICLDTKTGEEVWRRTDMKLDHKEGPGSSPLLWRDLLILTLDGTDVQYVAALDKHTGRTVWKTNRTHDLSDRKEDLRKTYSTPIVIHAEGREQLISQGAYCIYSYDPASGKELWRLPTAGFSTVARPHYEDGLLFVNSGFVKPQLWAIRPAGSGVLDEKQAVVWKQLKNIPKKPSDIYHSGLLFMVDDAGIASCLDAKTGDEVFRERLEGKFSASPIATANAIYFANETGKTYVLKPSRTFEVMATNELESGMMASPAVSGDALFLRTTTHLYRIETK